MLRDLKQTLKQAARPDKAEFFPRFFQAFPGGYGEGDRFWGVMVPDCRKAARQFSQLSLTQLNKLLDDPIHECRLTALFIMVRQYDKGDLTHRQAIVDLYLSKLDRVNNWDLVDASAEKILGRHLEDSGRSLLMQLANREHLWSQRVAVIACLHFIKQGEFDEILRLAKRFLKHLHDLIHKAVGWMLRETGKRNDAVLLDFLRKHGDQMPRTMLRYAIERFPQSARKRMLQGDFDFA